MALVMSPENLIPPSAMIGTPILARRATLRDGGNLRHARAGHDARRANRSGPDADFQPVDAERDQIARAFGSGDIASEQLHVRQAVLHRADRVHHARGVAVRGVDCQHVHFFARHFFRAFQEIAGGADRRADAKRPCSSLVALGNSSFF